MADLVRARTEIECLIEDFKQAGELGEERRGEISEELERLETRIQDTSARLDALQDELDQRISEEKDAKEK